MILSILCVTQNEPHALPFLQHMAETARWARFECVIVADGAAAFRALSNEPSLAGAHIVPIRSQGFIESVLDDAVNACSGDYILRLDDDERMSPAMRIWVVEQEFRAAPHWSFPRVHLWPDVHWVLMTNQLFPDEQTRLSLKPYAGHRPHLHAPSPFGWGERAPVAIEHHKFLVKTVAQREETARKWHNNGMTAFSLPEHVYETVTVVSYEEGFVPWQPSATEERRMRP